MDTEKELKQLKIFKDQLLNLILFDPEELEDCKVTLVVGSNAVTIDFNGAISNGLIDTLDATIEYHEQDLKPAK